MAERPAYTPGLPGTSPPPPLGGNAHRAVVPVAVSRSTPLTVSPTAPGTALPAGPRRSFDEVFRSIADVQGWMTRAQACRLWDRSSELSAGDRVVEIGSYQGRSTVVLARARSTLGFSSLNFAREKIAADSTASQYSTTSRHNSHSICRVSPGGVLRQMAAQGLAGDHCAGGFGFGGHAAILVGMRVGHVGDGLAL